MRHIRLFLFAAWFTFGCVAANAQQSAILANITELSKNPRKFDGHLVQVIAGLEVGWEGDNFLVDLPASASLLAQKNDGPRVWFYAKDLGIQRKIGQVYRITGPKVFGTFTGYFHFVPDRKSRMKDVFDPGPWQLEITRVSDLITPHRAVK